MPHSCVYLGTIGLALNVEGVYLKAQFWACLESLDPIIPGPADKNQAVPQSSRGGLPRLPMLESKRGLKRAANWYVQTSKVNKAAACASTSVYVYVCSHVQISLNMNR